MLGVAGGVDEGVVVCEAEGVVGVVWVGGRRLAEGWVEGCVGGVVEVVLLGVSECFICEWFVTGLTIVMTPFMVVFVVVSIVGCTAHVVDIDFLPVILPMPFVSHILPVSVRRISS